MELHPEDTPNLYLVHHTENKKLLCGPVTVVSFTGDNYTVTLTPRCVQCGATPYLHELANVSLFVNPLHVQKNEKTP